MELPIGLLGYNPCELLTLKTGMNMPSFRMFGIMLALIELVAGVAMILIARRNSARTKYTGKHYR